MKRGICLTPIYPKAVTDAKYLCQLIDTVGQEQFYDCVEVYFEGTEEEQNAIKERVRANHLVSVYPGGLPMKRDRINLSASSETERLKSVEETKGHIERAIRMGCSKIVVVSGPIWEEPRTEDVIEQMTKSLVQLDEFSKGSGVEISLEHFPYKTDPYLAVGQSEMVEAIFRSTTFHNTGITFDTSHVSQMKENVWQSFCMLRPWIHHLHLANCVMDDPKNELYGDKHPLFSVENGDFSLEDIASFYRKVKQENGLQNIDICSLEIVSRGREKWYYDEAKREAEYIFRQ